MRTDGRPATLVPVSVRWLLLVAGWSVGWWLLWRVPSVRRRPAVDGAAGGNLAHLQNARRDPDRRRDRRRTAAEGLAAVERIARPDEIVMKGLAEHQPVRRREARTGVRQHRLQLLEPGPLGRVLRIVRIVGGGEMAHDQAEIERGQRALVALKL